MKTLPCLLIVASLTLLPKLAWAQQVDFTGRWVLDEQLSQPMDPILELQGVPWPVRRSRRSRCWIWS